MSLPTYFVVKSLKDDGKTNREIANQLKISTSDVQKFIHYAETRASGADPSTPKTYELIAEGVKSGKSTQEIADELGIALHKARGLRAYAIRVGLIEPCRRNTCRRPDVVALRKMGATPNHIAKELGMGIRNVYRQIATAKNLGELPEEPKTQTRPRAGNIEKEFRSMSQEARAYILAEMQPGDTIASAMKEIVLDKFYEDAERNRQSNREGANA